ncbi:hypothetical protein DXV75_12660 [Alteromonas aestuariivivens]|uniref:Neuraminidase n=1 Tax=Alteromonas aestuariivivens TaxID=1938339 RepID=A0A3D8M4Y0_9ALTE|nr:hypothetical protein DXV75_12660 [Alteromonas aestuariivivens]
MDELQRIGIVAVFCLVVSICRAGESEQVDYFADNALGNPLALVQHPAGIHSNGVTYIAYQGPLEDPYIVAYNHKTQQWQGPVKAGTSDLGKNLHIKPKTDNHGKPTLLIDDLGYIHVFFGGHGAGSKYGNNPLGRGGVGRNKHVVSVKPHDISEWQELDNISVFGTYNQAVKMDNGDIYLIYRHGAHRSDWVYQKSVDHGRTFAEPVSFLKHQQRTDLPATDSWYVWATRGKNDDIIFAYDYHLCWLQGEGPRGRGHVTERHDLYYMVFNTQSNSWRNIHNQSLAIPLTRELADKQTRVVETPEDHWTFMGSAHLDGQGYPHIALNSGRDTGVNTGGPKQTLYYRWDGTQWLGGKPVHSESLRNNTDTRGDFAVTSSNEVTFALGYEEQGSSIIGYLQSKDGGTTFNRTKSLLTSKNAEWALTALIDNAHPEARLIVAEKLPGNQWHKIYLVGDNGPVPRARSEADVLTPDDTRVLQ